MVYTSNIGEMKERSLSKRRKPRKVEKGGVSF